MLEMEEEIECGLGGEAITNGVTIGDNTVMPCESRNGEQFWLLLCEKPKNMVTKTFNVAYKNTYYEGNSVIQGWYYELIRPQNMTYYFNDNGQHAYVYSHIVCASKFAMPPTLHTIKGNYPTFELPNDTLQLIEESFKDLRLMHNDD
jgi:hypothetical protein